MDIDIEKIKNILSQTTTSLKHSSSTFKKIKEKMTSYEKELNPTPEIKAWFDKRSLQYAFPDFFDALFSEANREKRLDYTAKTIVFAEEDAEIFGFEVGVPVTIYSIFENIPFYFP
jgi:hypothetical protein